jgi:hypothetical protein
MSHTIGLHSSSSWTQIVRRPASGIIIRYIVTKWIEYVARFEALGEPLHERDEPTLTKGLSAFLAHSYEVGQQPFDGDFFGELSRYDLAPDGTAVCNGRTDLEWRLYGFPCFIAEFKILDGSRKRRELYVMPSQLAPEGARFDTAHQRDGPALSPIRLAHIFLALQSTTAPSTNLV